jgi:hypothetical protein
VNELTTNFQYAYWKGHSKSTSLTQMTDWMRETDDDTYIWVAGLLDFSAAFDIIDHSLQVEKRVLWFNTPCFIELNI